MQTGEKVMKKIILISLFGLAAWNCGEGDASGWSSSQQQAYLNGCMSSGIQSAEKEGLCKCTLDPVMKKYSFSEYRELEVAMMTGNASQEFTEFILEVSFECVGVDLPKAD